MAVTEKYITASPLHCGSSLSSAARNSHSVISRHQPDILTS